MYLNKTIILFTLASVLLLSSCTTDSLENPVDKQLTQLLNQTSPSGSFDHYILPSSDDIASIPQDSKNPLSKGKISLGKMLFYETGLALAPHSEFFKGFYSCATCHVPSVGFMPGRIQGIADGGVGFGEEGEQRIKTSLYEEDEIDVQGARPLSLINVAFSTNTSWSGMFGGNDANAGTEELWHAIEAAEVNFLGYSGLESQNIEGLKLHRMVVNPTVIDTLGYKEMYDQCFPDFDESERYSDITTSLAISAYLRSLIANEAPFQKWLKGDEKAMSVQEKRGAELFFSKAGCFRCHNTAALNNPDDFYALGVKDLYETGEAFATGPDDQRNFGRGFFTQKDSDLFKFKVPQLYNIGETPFFFHGSSKQSLREVIEYFNDGVPENPRVPGQNIAPQFHPLNLTDLEITDLVEFLKVSLCDQNIERYVPEEVLSGNCFPNNDPASRVSLGCD